MCVLNMCVTFCANQALTLPNCSCRPVLVPQALPQHGRIQPLWFTGGLHRPQGSGRTQGQLLFGRHHVWLWPPETLRLHVPHPGNESHGPQLVLPSSRRAGTPSGSAQTFIQPPFDFTLTSPFFSSVRLTWTELTYNVRGKKTKKLTLCETCVRSTSAVEKVN